MKKVTLRLDLISNTMLPSNELIRIVKLKTGQVVVDSEKKLNGRGVYLAPNLDGLAMVKKKRLIQRSLRTDVDDALFEAIAQEIKLNWD